MLDQVVVTGAAGFIGARLSEELLLQGTRVVGIDSLTPAYDPTIKRARLARLAVHPAFTFIEGDLATLALAPVLRGARAVFHEAGQPGVRSSWGTDFDAYVHNNVVATQRLLEACQEADVLRVVAASSSSVYGDARAYPTSEQALPQPVSPYGVTKLAAEHLCMAYGTPTARPALTVIALRYFTVYGPGQRPDMAFQRFFRAAYRDEPIVVFGDGQQTRDFTFVGDAVRANLMALHAPATSVAVNIGGGQRVTLNHVLDLIADITGRALRIQRTGQQRGDVRHTACDATLAGEVLGYAPITPLEQGLREQADAVARDLGLSKAVR